MLFLKMLRDMKNNKMQFISIGLMTFLAIFVYAGIGSEWYTFQKGIDSYYAETHLADIWLYGKSFTDSDVAKLLKVDSVSDASRRLHLEGTADLRGDPELEILLMNEAGISSCKVISGESFDPAADGIWLSDKFAEARGISVGDTLDMQVEGIVISKKILGIMISPEYVYASASFDSMANPRNIGVVYGGMDLLPQGFPKVYNQIAALLNTTDYQKAEEQIEKKLDGTYSVFLSREGKGSYQQFREEILQNKAMGDLFPFVFIAVALLTIMTTMSRIINNQRTQIGTLKALGYKDKKIMRHFICYGMIPSLAGALLGLIVGPLTLTPLFFEMQSGLYSLPPLTVTLLPQAVFAAGGAVAACTLVTWIACNKILKEKPADALRTRPPRISRHMWFEKTAWWKGTGFDFQWNLRDTLRSKVRSIMAVVGITGCMSLLTCALGMVDSLNNINEWKYGQLTQYRNKVLLTDDLSASDIPYPGETIQEGSIELRANGIKKTTGVTVLEPESSLTVFTDSRRKEQKLPVNGVSISYHMADILGVEVGDEVSWHLYGESKWADSKIKAIYRDPVAQGITLYEDYFEEQGYHYQPTSFLTKANIDPDAVTYTVWNIEKLKSSVTEMMDTMYSIIYIMVAAAVLMAVVVLYNLGVLSFTEKLREFATLRVLGFKSEKIRLLMLRQNIWLSALGLIPGYLLGKWIIDLMCGMLGDNFDMMTEISLPSIVISVAITMLVSVGVNVLFSRKVKEIDMVSALKGAE
ncbi:MAG: FtsX-like permease family protein [Clostridiales bacterium]|nr:ABC transporter permease [Clostridiales bacterium]MDU3243207.1 FtsX-like permease family protein [Clostridiales bacterium]